MCSSMRSVNENGIVGGLNAINSMQDVGYLYIIGNKFKKK